MKSKMHKLGIIFLCALLVGALVAFVIIDTIKENDDTINNNSNNNNSNYYSKAFNGIWYIYQSFDNYGVEQLPDSSDAEKIIINNGQIISFVRDVANSYSIMYRSNTEAYYGTLIEVVIKINDNKLIVPSIFGKCVYTKTNEQPAFIGTYRIEKIQGGSSTDKTDITEQMPAEATQGLLTLNMDGTCSTKRDDGTVLATGVYKIQYGTQIKITLTQGAEEKIRYADFVNGKFVLEVSLSLEEYQQTGFFRIYYTYVKIE